MLVNMILLRSATQLDLTGPYEVLARMPDAKIELVATSLDPVATDKGLAILPTTTRETAGEPDLLVVPGGPGVDEAILDPDWVDFTARQGRAARWVFGICTGSLLLGAAGLLQGRRAGGHWQARDLLAQFGAEVSHARMTMDGKFFTSGGVTAGIDMALKLVAEVAGEEEARRIQLQIEYDPEPPFRSGTPFVASAETVEAALAATAARREARKAAVEKAAARLKAGVTAAASLQP
jgi:cyclohexyl-isocyanide hydratase